MRFPPIFSNWPSCLSLLLCQSAFPLTHALTAESLLVRSPPVSLTPSLNDTTLGTFCGTLSIPNTAPPIQSSTRWSLTFVLANAQIWWMDKAVAPDMMREPQGELLVAEPGGWSRDGNVGEGVVKGGEFLEVRVCADVIDLEEGNGDVKAVAEFWGIEEPVGSSSSLVATSMSTEVTAATSSTASSVVGTTDSKQPSTTVSSSSPTSSTQTAFSESSSSSTTSSSATPSPKTSTLSSTSSIDPSPTTTTTKAPASPLQPIPKPSPKPSKTTSKIPPKPKRTTTTRAPPGLQPKPIKAPVSTTTTTPAPPKLQPNPIKPPVTTTTTNAPLPLQPNPIKPPVTTTTRRPLFLKPIQLGRGR